ncbi:MAG: hypothetical protein ACD_80C00214G0003 [uncultured bacterium (gcode 4)]|uniref:Uncharacterized protein n=1 Tax=uncultured bacterium (gcode 4) TaxID=1234023 RepID=K1YGQ3_9BACT|nr:MAG: hypothetical protein ACD_80C00214G0003 [uncultured bacterium (gcode 4)]
MTPPIWKNPITLENVENLTDVEIDIFLNSKKVKARIIDNLIAKNNEELDKQMGISELEEQNHREKSDKTRKIKKESAKIWDWKKYTIEKIEVKTNPEWDIKEYVSWVPNHLIWEQLFSKKALRRLKWSFGRLPTKRMIQKIINTQPWETIDEKYVNFRKKYIEHRLAGSLETIEENFHDINWLMHCWLDGYGDCANFGQDTWADDHTYVDSFYSVCFLKESLVINPDVVSQKEESKWKKNNKSWKIKKNLNIWDVIIPGSRWKL